MRLTPTTTRELLQRHDVRPVKRLGQHFLIDPNIVERIVRAVDGDVGDPVIEIGAGLGTLTRALADAGYDVVAFEVDERMRPVLAETIGDRAEVRFVDAASLSLGEELDDRAWVMAANLPYNVGTPLVLDALRHTPQVRRFVIMLQAEVVDRFVADPGNPNYGMPSVVVGLHAAVRDRFAVPSQVFHPRPSVDSAVVVLDRVAAPEHAEQAIELAGTAFGQRRKMLRSSLRPIVSESALKDAGIDPTQRPEELVPAQWVRLAEVIG